MNPTLLQDNYREIIKYLDTKSLTKFSEANKSFRELVHKRLEDEKKIYLEKIDKLINVLRPNHKLDPFYPYIIDESSYDKFIRDTEGSLKQLKKNHSIISIKGLDLGILLDYIGLKYNKSDKVSNGYYDVSRMGLKLMIKDFHRNKQLVIDDVSKNPEENIRKIIQFARKNTKYYTALFRGRRKRFISFELDIDFALINFIDILFPLEYNPKKTIRFRTYLDQIIIPFMQYKVFFESREKILFTPDRIKGNLNNIVRIIKEYGLDYIPDEILGFFFNNLKFIV